MLNYTYSKTIDDLGTFRVGDNPRLDRSISTADEPQNLAGTAVYALPIGRDHIGSNNFFVRAIGSDWLLSGIATYHSGFPIAFTGTGCGTSSILNQCMPSVIPGWSAASMDLLTRLPARRHCNHVCDGPVLQCGGFPGRHRIR